MNLSGENKFKKIPGYITTDAVTWFNLKENSKKNRKNPTDAEEILWEAIKNNKLGHRFRRQHIVNKYMPDFVCLKKKLIIELDGEIHKFHKIQDEERTKVLNSDGYRILRFKNEQVKEDLNSVINIILSELSKI